MKCEICHIRNATRGCEPVSCEECYQISRLQYYHARGDFREIRDSLRSIDEEDEMDDYTTNDNEMLCYVAGFLNGGRWMSNLVKKCYHGHDPDKCPNCKYNNEQYEKAMEEKESHG